MSQKKKVILIGEPGTVQNHLATVLPQNNMIVSLHPADVTAQKLLGEFVPPGTSLRVIFTPGEHSEFKLLEHDLETGGTALLDHVEKQVKAYLLQCQAALKLLMLAGGGQLWVCDYDDSFAYHLDTPANPIVAQAKAAALRCIAKEYSRMNIYANSLFLQPLMDESNASDFRAAAGNLKTFAMRYKPGNLNDVSGLLIPFLQTERLAFSGAVIASGTGVQQSHLIA